MTAHLPQNSSPRTHLLVNGDVIAFIAAAACQHKEVDAHRRIRPVAYEPEGEAVVDNLLLGLRSGLKAQSFEVVLSDPADNWRRAVDPAYKANRSDPLDFTQRPLLLDYLKDYLGSKYAAYHWPGLEADDVLGIKMTDPGARIGYALAEVKPICVGRDKDFKTIPGLHHSIKQDVGPSGQMLVREVSPWEAERFHLMQALAGDRVDGYYGCPTIGLDRAAQILDAPTLLAPKQGVKTRGVNKGEAVTKWFGEPTRDLWACIVSHYRKQGLGEADALRTARLARILHHGEYDQETREVTLWTPDKITRR